MSIGPGLGSAADTLGLVEKSQYFYVEKSQYFYDGRDYCWYPDGWHGPGFYWCGYNLRAGYGWGGPIGWRGWRVGGPGFRRFGGPGLRSRSVATSLTRRPGFQVPFAEEIRRELSMSTAAVGLIVNPKHAESILQDNPADLVCLGRDLLFNPQCSLHAVVELEGETGYDIWLPQYEWALRKRARWAATYRQAGTAAAE